jgi:hypothetical protein
MKLSEKTKEILLRAGWDELRQINISEHVLFLKSEGYTITESAKKFIAEFGDLEIIHPAYRVKNENDKTHFNPSVAANHIYYERVETYEQKIREKLVVVGEAFNEHLILMISESGKFFGAYDDYLTLLGNDTYEGINSICEGKDTPAL